MLNYLYRALEIPVGRFLGKSDTDVFTKSWVVETALYRDVEDFTFWRKRNRKHSQPINLKLNTGRLGFIL